MKRPLLRVAENDGENAAAEGIRNNAAVASFMVYLLNIKVRKIRRM